MEKILSPAPHVYAVNPYPPHQGIIMPPYMQQHPHHNYYYYQPPSSEEAMHHQQVPVPTSCSSSAFPYGVNYSTSCYPLYHAPPTPFCCNHIPHSSYSPSVVLQPPQPQPLQLWGAQPVHHILPPSYVVAETPRYKNSTVNHCCGCPNHVCTPKDASPIIKDEEKEQSPRRGGGGAEDQSLRLADYPYPFHVWRVPAFDHEKNKNELQPPEQLDSHDTTHSHMGSSHPTPRNLLPFQVGDLLRLGDGRNSQNQQQQGEDRKQFPFPFVLVPYSSSKQDDGSENIQNKDGCLRSSQDHSVLGTKNDSYNSGRLGGGHSAADMKEVLRPKEISASSSKKEIPVKDAVEPPHGHHPQHDDDEKRMRSAAPENSTTEDGSCTRADAIKKPEEKEGSQVKKNKSCKLPPVCLRLEPLRKKKTVGDKEGSRSPSSPATKNATTSVEGTHSVTSSDNNKKHHPVEKKVKMIEVKDDTGKDGEDVFGTSTTIQTVEEEKSQKNAATGGGCETTEDSATSASSEEEKNTEQPELQKRRKMLSETEAATYIQAVYRGFEVRKSETLEKLKQLGKIHDEVTKMKKSVEDLKFPWSSNNENAVDQVKLTKQKMAIGESIMGLLLRLDTIQGIHPSLRDIRKSMAKELVALQEQLDSISSSRSCCDEASLKEEKNKEHGDMYCAAEKEFNGVKEKESPIPEVMHQETLSEDAATEEDSLPLEAKLLQQQQAVECSEMESASEERADIIIQPPEEEDGTVDAMTKMEQKSTTRTIGEVEAAEEEKSEEKHQMKTDGDEDNNAAFVGGDESCHKLPVTELPLGVVSESEEKKKAAEVPISNTEESAETVGSISCEAAPSPDRDEEVSDGVEDEKKKRLDEKEDDDDGLLHKKYIVTDEEEDHQDKEEAVGTGGLGDEQQSGSSSSSSSNVVAAAPEEEEEEECVAVHRDDDDDVDVGGEQVVQVDDNGEQCKVAFMSCGHEEDEREMKEKKERVVVLEEEKEKMQEMMQKLMDAGKEQLDVMLSLTSRVKDLERKLATTTSRRRKKRIGNNKTKQKQQAVLRQQPQRQSVTSSEQSN